jgi:hypothetical protein
LVWDSDPDFIEYKYRDSPEGPSEKKALISKKPSTTAKSRTKGAVKSEPATSGSLVSMASTTIDTGASTTSSSVSELPTFVRADWISCFLPTLYHRFGSSENPWKMFTKGGEMLLIIQELIDAVYPANRYRVKWGDKISTMVLVPLLFFAMHFIPF